jgi:transcriptional regulator of NAD metabolism
MEYKSEPFHHLRSGKTREDLERMFINRPLEPHIHFLSAWVDVHPVLEDVDKWFESMINDISLIVDASLQLIELSIVIKNEKRLKVHNAVITYPQNLTAISSSISEQLRSNYIKIFSELSIRSEYEEIINERLYAIKKVILEHPIFEFDKTMNDFHGDTHLAEGSLEQYRMQILSQKAGLKRLKSTIDYSGVNEILRILTERNAKFNSQLFQDIYNFCDETGYISEEQKRLHSTNARTTAQIDYIRAAYNRLKKAGTL